MLLSFLFEYEESLYTPVDQEKQNFRKEFCEHLMDPNGIDKKLQAEGISKQDGHSQKRILGNGFYKAALTLKNKFAVDRVIDRRADDPRAHI